MYYLFLLGPFNDDSEDDHDKKVTTFKDKQYLSDCRIKKTYSAKASKQVLLKLITLTKTFYFSAFIYLLPKSYINTK